MDTKGEGSDGSEQALKPGMVCKASKWLSEQFLTLPGKSYGLDRKKRPQGRSGGHLGASSSLGTGIFVLYCCADRRHVARNSSCMFWCPGRRRPVLPGQRGATLVPPALPGWAGHHWGQCHPGTQVHLQSVVASITPPLHLQHHTLCTHIRQEYTSLPPRGAQSLHHRVLALCWFRPGYSHRPRSNHS